MVNWKVRLNGTSDKNDIKSRTTVLSSSKPRIVIVRIKKANSLRIIKVISLIKHISNHYLMQSLRISSGIESIITILQDLINNKVDRETINIALKESSEFSMHYTGSEKWLNFRNYTCLRSPSASIYIINTLLNIPGNYRKRKYFTK
jgi:hypothetical protein